MQARQDVQHGDLPVLHARQGAAEAARRRDDRRDPGRPAARPSARRWSSLTGRWTVPQIFIGETHVGGCDELVALDRRGGLEPLLAGDAIIAARWPRRRSPPASARRGDPTFRLRELPWPTTPTRPRVPDPAHLPEGSVARAAELAADPARAGPAAGRDQPRASAPSRSADGMYEVTRDGDGDDQGQRQDAVPRRGQAGRHLRDPQHPRRAAASRSSASPARASSIRTCARSSPTSAPAPASRRWCSRKSTSRRCTKRSRRRPQRQRRRATARARRTVN